MKTILLSLVFLFVLVFTLNKATASDLNVQPTVRVIEMSQITAHTADAIFELAEELQSSDPLLLQANVDELSFSEKIKLAKGIQVKLKEAKLKGTKPDKTVLYILCVFVSPIAVGLWTNWQMPTLYNLLFYCCYWAPGVVHGFYVLLR